MKRILLCLLVLSLLLPLTSCAGISLIQSLFEDAGKGTAARLAEMTGVPLENGEVLASYDTHGGFHGDGAYCAVLSVTDPEAARAIETSWQALPLPTVLLEASEAWPDWDAFREQKDYRSLNLEGDPWEIADGYYFYRDRFSGTDAIPDDGCALNFTLLIYDRERALLFVYELDT